METQSRKRLRLASRVSPYASVARARGVMRRFVRRRAGARRAMARSNVREAGVLGVELKAFDTHRTAVAISNDSTWAGGEYETATYGLFCPTQGTGISSRDGAHCVVKSILVNGCVYGTDMTDQADAHNPILCQVALVMDRQTNGAQLNAEDVYDATDPCVPAIRVLEYSKRFKVLRTVTISIGDTVAMTDGANTASITGNMVPFVLSWKGNIPVDFISTAGAGAVADLKDVSFHIIAVKNGARTVNIEYNSRVRYVG